MTCEVSGTTPPLGGPQRRRAENLSEMYPPTTTSLDISENTTANPNVVFWESGSAEEGRDAQAQTIRAGGASRRGRFAKGLGITHTCRYSFRYVRRARAVTMVGGGGMSNVMLNCSPTDLWSSSQSARHFESQKNVTRQLRAFM